MPETVEQALEQCPHPMRWVHVCLAAASYWGIAVGRLVLDGVALVRVLHPPSACVRLESQQSITHVGEALSPPGGMPT